MNNKDFPSSAVIPGFPQPQRDQGARETCVAFSTAALIEYFLKFKFTVSPQYLYACCKAASGNDNTGGTSISGAFAALKEYGFISADDWAYNPFQTAGEAQTDPARLKEFSPEFLSECEMKLLFTPENINEYKAAICGSSTHRPMPVIAGLAIYGSGTGNNDGFWEMPLPWDKPSGGHAVLIYGYKDVPHIPGGGYFIAQNSANSNGSNVVKIPYEYLRTQAMEAGTIFAPPELTTSTPVSVPESKSQPEVPQAGIEQYISTAPNDMADAFGKFSIAAGNRIIVDPATGEALPDTPHNREEFIKNSFSHKIRFSEELSSRLNAAGNDLQLFQTALDTNIQRNIDGVIPNINLPWWVYLIPWPFQFKFKHFNICRTCEREFADFLSAHKIHPEYKKLREEDLRKLINASSFKVYELSTLSVRFRIVAMFVAVVDAGGEKLLPAGFDCRKLMTEFYEKWAKESGVGNATATCMVFASAAGWSSDVTPVQSHDSIICLAAPPAKRSATARGWDFLTPAAGNLSEVYSKFISNLYPETPALQCSRVEDYILNSAWQGNFTVEHIAERLNLDPRHVEECFDKLQSGGKYINYYTSGKQEAIRLAADYEKPGKVLFARKKFLRTAALHLMMCALMWGATWTIRALFPVLREFFSETVTFAIMGGQYQIISCIKNGVIRKLTK